MGAFLFFVFAFIVIQSLVCFDFRSQSLWVFRMEYEHLEVNGNTDRLELKYQLPGTTTNYSTTTTSRVVLAVVE